LPGKSGKMGVRTAVVHYIKPTISDKPGVLRKGFLANVSFGRVYVAAVRGVGAGHCRHRVFIWGDGFTGPVSWWWSWPFGRGGRMGGAPGNSGSSLELAAKPLFDGWPILAMYFLQAPGGKTFVAG